MPEALKVGLIGYPVEHSVSPPMQQAAFDHYQLPARYGAWATLPEELPERVNGLRASGFLGANVTVPHKEAVLPLLDELSPDAQAIGAANTIVNRGGRLFGYNTDVDGFLHALREDASFAPRGKRVIVLGAGGAARAVVYGLMREGVRELAVFNRHVGRAERLLQDLWRALGPQDDGMVTRVLAAPLREVGFSSYLANCDLLVNATAVGLRSDESPIALEHLPARALICDLIYNPQATRLLRDAHSRGNRTLGGLPMLIYQGAASFTLWTGKEAPVALMREAAQTALRRMGAR